MNSTLIYTIDNNDKVVSTNSEWTTFAKQNDAASLEYSVHGKSIWNFIGVDKLKKLYVLLFDGVRSTHNAVSINFRCDNSQVLKFMNMNIEPLQDGFLKISTRLLREISRKRALAREVFYLGINNGIPMCSNCNRIYIGKNSSWIEIEKALGEDLISDELNVTFDVCNECMDYFDKTIDNLHKS